MTMNYMNHEVARELEDEAADRLATPAEAVNEWRFNVGADDANQDRQWLLHDRDVWVKNPFYVGAPQPHPEDDHGDVEDYDHAAFLADLAARRLEDAAAPVVEDDCPF
jgi:hypothetical protein